MASQSMRLVVETPVVQIVTQLPPRVVKVIGNNEAFRHPINESLAYEYHNGVLVVENGAVLNTLLDILSWAERYNHSFLKTFVNERYVELVAICKTLPPDEALRVFRKMRVADRLSNYLSKRELALRTGDSTYAKVNILLQRYNLGSMPKVVFGVSSPMQGMSNLSDVEAFIDPISVGCGKYKVGNIKDWKKYVKPGHLVVSDASVGLVELEGMQIPPAFYSIYREMAQSNLVICKVDRLASQVAGWEYRDALSVREYNRELFLLIGPGQTTYSLDVQDQGEQVMQANLERMRKIRYREYCPNIRSSITKEVFDGIGEREVVPKVKQKFALDLLPGCAPGRSWQALCLDRGARFVSSKFKMKISLDLPIVLMDVGFLSKDPERLMSSFFDQYDLEYDDLIGWVATDVKK